MFERSVFGGGRRVCRRRLHQRHLLLHRGGGGVLRSAGSGWRILRARGGGGRAASEATSDFFEGLALRLWDFEKGEDEKDDEEGGEDEENPGPTELLRRQEPRVRNGNMFEIFGVSPDSDVPNIHL